MNEILRKEKNSKYSAIVREKRIYIEIQELKKIKKELYEKGIPLYKLRKLIGMSFEHLYYSRSNSINEASLYKLETILKRKIFHKIKLGKIIECQLQETEKLVELINIILGDGGLYSPPESARNVVSFNLNRVDEQDYVNYVKKLIYELFQIYPSETVKKNEKGIVLRLYGKAIVDFLISKGLSSGNKTINQVNVPDWIKKNKNFIISGLKGLFDTDGSIWVNRLGKSIILSFRNASLPLAKDFKQMCEKLNIRTQPKISKYQKIDKETGKIYVAYQVFISSKHFVKRFLEIIDPEKWKDKNRREYLGIKLIISNSTNEIQKKNRKQISIDYPKSSNRTYTLEFSHYLKKLCINHGFFNINKNRIEEALKNALKYKYQKSNRNSIKK